jgi:hypothetical protein
LKEYVKAEGPAIEARGGIFAAACAFPAAHAIPRLYDKKAWRRSGGQPKAVRLPAGTIPQRRTK